MRILPLAEQGRWLQSQALPADPYKAGGETFEFYLQFYPPKHLGGIECFSEGLISYAGVGGEALMTVVDTECPREYDERLFNRIRYPVGEGKSIYESPAHLFSADELPDLIPIFSLTVAWQWEAYLHMPRTRTVLLNWEGDIFDLWTDDRAVYLGVSEMLKEFSLSEVAGSQPGDPANGGRPFSPDSTSTPPAAGPRR